ncbi:MAG: cell division protein ZapA [Alphaproteobacteria bacterium]
MPLVNVLVNNRAYTVACDEGEEEHLRELARFVDGRVRQLVETVGQAGDARLLLMASLLVADELSEAKDLVSERDREIAGLRHSQHDAEAARKTEDQLAEVLEKAAREIEDIAAGLARA